jgi:hypothetical protein
MPVCHILHPPRSSSQRTDWAKHALGGLKGSNLQEPTWTKLSFMEPLEREQNTERESWVCFYNQSAYKCTQTQQHKNIPKVKYPTNDVSKIRPSQQHFLGPLLREEPPKCFSDIRQNLSPQKEDSAPPGQSLAVLVRHSTNDKARVKNQLQSKTLKQLKKLGLLDVEVDESIVEELLGF